MAKSEYYMKFLYGLRKIELSDDAHIMLGDNISPKLSEYVHALNVCRFVDGSYYTYYGDIQTIINVFVNYWMDIMNDVIKQADRYTNIGTKDELLDIVERTISMHQIKQVDFGREILPVKTQSDQELYEEVERRYKAVLESLIQLKDRVEKFRKKTDIEECMKEKALLSIKKINECFQFAHTYISYGLTDNVYKIRVSLEEILSQVRKNMCQLEDKRDKDITDLHNQLYDKNKEHLHITRQHRSCSLERAEVLKYIGRLKERIENPVLNVPIVHVTEEVRYWETRFTEFVKIENIIKKVKKAQENVKDLENEYKNMRTTAQTGAVCTTCFNNIGENIKWRMEHLDDKIIQASKALLTFFGIRGCSRIFYKSHIGKFVVDEYGHQVYFTDYGENQYHVTCDGIFNEVPYTDKHYYDFNGRYIMGETGEKIYQVAPCTSEYKLGDDSILHKTTIDCGHSTKANPQCKMKLKEPSEDVAILPNLDPMDIKGTLKPEIVKYLWDCIGPVIPDALRDVGDLAPKNPIHILAHRIISQRYDLNTTELKKKVEEAEKFRDKMLNKDKQIAESNAWKSKQVKRRKPEESDDSQDRAIYNQYLARNQFISFLDC